MESLAEEESFCHREQRGHREPLVFEGMSQPLLKRGIRQSPNWLIPRLSYDKALGHCWQLPVFDSGILPQSIDLPRRIEIRILPHLLLHFLAFFFVIEHHLAVAEVAAFDATLGFVEK